MSSAGHNLESRNQCKFVAAGDRVDTDPRLGPLADNGGPTLTLALLTGSPAIDAGLDCPAVDQRGVARPQGPGCDIGAFELVPTPPAADGDAGPGSAAGRPDQVPRQEGQGRPGDGQGQLQGELRQRPRRPLPGHRRVPYQDASARCWSECRETTFASGTAAGTVAGGSVGRLKVKLNARGQALLAAAPTGFRVMATGTSRNRSGAASAVRHGLKIVPRAHRHH